MLIEVKMRRRRVGCSFTYRELLDLLLFLVVVAISDNEVLLRCITVVQD